MKDRRFLIIGCGSIGQRHLRNLRQLGAADIAVFDPDPMRRSGAQAEHGVETFADLHKALASQPFAALICSPTRLHAEQGLEAARAGCHLFIEKPLAASWEQVPLLLDEVGRRGLRTLVGCNFRFHPGLQRVKTLLDERAIGRVVSGRAQFGQYLPDWHPSQDYRREYSASRELGGGVVLDRIHEIDYLRWLLGECDLVFGLTGRLSHLEIDTEDTAEILVRFVSGAFGSIHVDYIRRTYDCSVEIIGEQGTIRWSYQDAYVEWYTAADRTWQRVRWVQYDSNQMYAAEMSHFLHVLAGEEPSMLDAHDAARVLRIALAAREAALDGRARVP